MAEKDNDLHMVVPAYNRLVDFIVKQYNETKNEPFSAWTQKKRLKSLRKLVTSLLSQKYPCSRQEAELSQCAPFRVKLQTSKIQKQRGGGLFFRLTCQQLP